MQIAEVECACCGARLPEDEALPLFDGGFACSETCREAID